MAVPVSRVQPRARVRVRWVRASRPRSGLVETRSGAKLVHRDTTDHARRAARRKEFFSGYEQSRQGQQAKLSRG